MNSFLHTTLKSRSVGPTKIGRDFRRLNYINGNSKLAQIVN